MNIDVLIYWRMQNNFETKFANIKAWYYQWIKIEWEIRCKQRPTEFQPTDWSSEWLKQDFKGHG